MNLPFFGRPKWKHPDPVVRLTAVERLSDPASLVEVAESDESRDVRLAAVRRLTDVDSLVHLAKSRSDIAAEALDRVADPGRVVDVARLAEQPEVRARAVGRLEDVAAIQRVATQDTSALVRRIARAKLAGPNTMRELLKTVLNALKVVPPAGGADAGRMRTTLDGICDALVGDSRFRIHGLIGSIAESAPDGSAAPLTPPPRSSMETVISGATVLELIGNQNSDHTAGGAYRLSSYYHIEIRRTDENGFELTVQQRESVAPFTRPGSTGLASG